MILVLPQRLPELAFPPEKQPDLEAYQTMSYPTVTVDIIIWLGCQQIL